jgi:hypothetical protein
LKDDGLDILQLPAGEAVISFVIANYQADQPSLLEGGHGIGKSALIEQAARRLGIEYVTLDLSLLDAVDLTGMPYIGKDRRTHHAPPTRLPVDGKGLLLLEELNRAPELTRAPCLQLCTARQLNDYVLPPGWNPVAAINPRRDGHATDDLDPALLSRFSRVRVVPDRSRWVEWAHGAAIHPAVSSFVDLSPDVFANRDPNPRSWAYVSNILKTWEQGRQGELHPLVAGLVGEVWSVAFLRHYQEKEKVLTGRLVAGAYVKRRKLIQHQLQEGRLDLVEATTQSLKHYLRGVKDDPGRDASRNIRLFLDDLPGDMKIQLRAWLAQNGLQKLLKRG